MTTSRRFLIAQLAAFAAGLALTIPAEVAKFRATSVTRLGWLAWFFWTDVDTTFPFVLLAIVPAIWFVRRRGSTVGDGERKPNSPKSRRDRSTRAPAARTLGRAWTMAIICALTSVAASAWVASFEIPIAEGKPPLRFGDLPPAIHDEFSYLFQAKTFLAGRLSFASSSRMPELFDQMHVVNEGRFASKYFPGVGLWLAPFVALGHPYWGQWLAGALTSFFMFWTGRELACSRNGPSERGLPDKSTTGPAPGLFGDGNGLGLAAGLLTALSPGMGIFDNLLLSHGPTMAGLSGFLLAFLRFMRTGRTADALFAGCGLAFAALCRPLTAAGFALPFGVWLAWRLGSDLLRVVRGRSTAATGPPVDRVSARALIALAAPLAVGFAFIFVDDYAITGNGFLSPYELYTKVYIPRHAYGFNNGVRGERERGPKVFDAYDRWAQNLTPGLAIENVVKRANASAQWTLGPVPVAMAVLVFLAAAVWQIESRWRLVAASVVSLHAVHIPFWLAGIMNWSYVFETGPLLLLIFAVTSRELIAWWRQQRQVLMPGWWVALAASAVVINWISFDPFWTARIDAGVDELAMPRVKYAKVEQLFDREVTKRPALVLIDGDPADTHVDFVVNDPDLTAPVLRGRYRPGKTDLNEVRAAFPDRTIYLFRVSSGRLTRLSP